MKKLLEEFYRKHSTIFLIGCTIFLYAALIGAAGLVSELQKELNQQAFEKIAKICKAENFKVTSCSSGVNVQDSHNFKKMVVSDMWEIGTSKTHFGKITRYDSIHSISYSFERCHLTAYYHVRLEHNKKVICVTFDNAMGLNEVSIVNPQSFCSDEVLTFYDECVEYGNDKNRGYYFYGKRRELPPYAYREVVLKDDKKWWKNTDKRMIANFFN